VDKCFSYFLFVVFYYCVTGVSQNDTQYAITAFSLVDVHVCVCPSMKFNSSAIITLFILVNVNNL